MPITPAAYQQAAPTYCAQVCPIIIFYIEEFPVVLRERNKCIALYIIVLPNDRPIRPKHVLVGFIILL
jgi:hypothetical protein